MGSIVVRGKKLYTWIKTVDGTWKRSASGHPDTSEGRAAAIEMLAELESKVEAERASLARVGANSAPPPTVRRWARVWSGGRAKLGKDARHEYARLEHHVLPVIGDMLVADIRTPHVIDLFTRIRTTPRPKGDKPLSPRTVHNIYGVFSLMLRDAELAGVLAHPPAPLDERHLGRKVDQDPEWRASAIFTRDEVQTLISSSKIPWDRRVVYAIELLAGTRPGEAAALRWRNYESAKKPLGELLVARSYSAKLDTAKGTKTDAVRHVPVHPTLAVILAEWRLQGWEQMIGRTPGPDDLIVPLPPADAAARTRKCGEPYRPDYYSRRRWVDEDLPALGWRHRRHYDTRATFITLALEDGADRATLETRVTHTKRTRSAFDMYNRGLQWEATCRELAKLRISRSRDRDAGALPARDHDAVRAPLRPTFVQSEQSRAFSIVSLAPEEGFEPPTRRLTAACSTTELLRNVWGSIDDVPGAGLSRRPARCGAFSSDERRLRRLPTLPSTRGGCWRGRGVRLRPWPRYSGSVESSSRRGSRSSCARGTATCSG